MDPNTPVVVGVGQFKQKLADVSDAQEQVALMSEALRTAISDSGAAALGSSIDAVYVVGGLWSYPDPGRMIAERVGSPDARTYLTRMGGNMPQTTVTHAAVEIEAGRAEVVVIAGGEAVYSRAKLRKLGRDLPRTGTEMTPAPRFGADITMSSEHERSLGFSQPTEVYPLFESALRARCAEPLEAHRRRIGQLWEGFNRVAVDNPYAWIRTPMTAEEITAASPSNRMVGLPYTKAMNANSFVDFGAAIVMTSVAKATDLGIPRDRWVFPLGAADGHATPLFSERDRLDTSPAIRETGRRCFDAAGVGVDEIAHMDLYSCFPCMPQITCAELDISADRVLTTTGGLSFFGGPMNSYVLHGIASLVDLLRADEGAVGFIHANGGYATKHACAVYSSAAPARPFRAIDAQPAIDRHPTRLVDEAPRGSAVIESFTVIHDRSGPTHGLLTALTPQGRRALGRVETGDEIDAMLSNELVGEPVTFDESHTAHL